MTVPFSKPIILSTLAFIVASGGSYGGYQVFKNYKQYGVNFDGRLHEVVEVVDGDTLVIENGIRVRLHGIDAPELGDCYGAEAQSGLAALVLGNKLRFEKDQDGDDRYGRLLRYVFVVSDNPKEGDVLVNRELVRAGYAEERYVTPNRRYLQQLQGAENEAQDEKVGLWGACDVGEETPRPEGEIGVASFDDECVIKGNITKSYEKRYFLPGCPNYKRVKVDVRKGEVWFCSEQDAQKAGWELSTACGNIHQFGGDAGGRYEDGHECTYNCE